ncbi:MAG TPA: ATP-binding protein [Ktedonobacteraceae bacterium]|nr:ATP-binding protein [Ktedonobacteraceae bacterium]
MYVPLQFRLTFLYVLLLALTLWFFGSIVYTQAAQRAYNDLDNTLSSRAASVQLGKNLVLQNGPINNLPAILPGIAGSGTEGVAIEVLDRQLHLLATTDSSSGNFLQTSVANFQQSPVPWDVRAAHSIAQNPLTGQNFSSTGTASSMYSTIAYQGQHMRVYTLANSTFGQVYIIQTARSEQDIEQSLASLSRVLWGGGILVILFAVFGGWLISFGLLRRVQHITQAASAISKSRRMHRRVADTTWLGRDELSHLAETFNVMLDNLEQLYHARQRFVADASHELRAPITSIRCNLDLLTAVPDLAPEDAQAALADARAEADRMGRLVNDLLTLARADAAQEVADFHSTDAAILSPANGTIDLDSLLLEVFRQYRPSPEHSRRASHEQPRLLLHHITPAQVAGDADQLKQALVALVDNALKYTPPDGTVSLALTTENNQAVVEVKDTGIGISPEDLPHIFERFYRADRARSRDQSGSGLGLSIAQSILQEHQGKIAVVSTQGNGSTFTIRLPLKSNNEEP